MNFFKVESINSQYDYFVQYFPEDELDLMKMDMFYNHIFRVTKL